MDGSTARTGCGETAGDEGKSEPVLLSGWSCDIPRFAAYDIAADEERITGTEDEIDAAFDGAAPE